MKLRNLFYLLLAMPLAFAACNEPVDEPVNPQPGDETKTTLTLTSNATMEFTATGGEGVITYTLENAVEGINLEATCEANWVLNLTAGETVTFAVAENEATEARESKVVVAYGELSFEVAVKQAGKNEAPKAPEFNLTSEETMEFDQDSAYGTITFEIVNPIDGVNVEAKSNASWVKNFAVRQADGQIAFEVEANTGAAREAKITATYGMLEFKVTVKQAEYVAPAPEIIIESANEEFEYEGGNGEIAFRIKNAVEGVEATATTAAEWITVTSCADGIVAFTVAENDTDAMREASIDIVYGDIKQEVKIKQLFEGYTPGLEYLVFKVVDVFASSKEGGKQWDVTFIEHDNVHGDMQTLICFNLAEVNAQRPTDGTYSVENGGILVNTATLNGFSQYRKNSLPADITVAELTVATNTEAKTIAINGTFQAGNAVVTLDYEGEVRGMDLGEAVTGAINHTEWTSVTKTWEENKELLFTAVSADGSLTAVFDFYDYDSSKVLAAGEYEVSAYYSGIGAHLSSSSYFKYNGVESQLASGSATVEHIAGGYKITYNVIDKLGREFTGVIEGAISGANNPA